LLTRLGHAADDFSQILLQPFLHRSGVHFSSLSEILNHTHIGINVCDYAINTDFCHLNLYVSPCYNLSGFLKIVQGEYMTLEMWIAIGILAFAIIFFVTEWLRLDVVALIVVIALMVSGLLTPAQAISGFSNTLVLTIAALFVIGGAILQTGLAGIIGNQVLKIAGTNPTRLLIVVMVAVAFMSAFMSSTGTVAVLLPAVVSLATSLRISPSKLLIPLAYASLLGGALTLIGTPPNLVVSDILRDNGYQQFQFFDFTILGGLLLLAGVIFMALIGNRLLPDRAPVRELTKLPTPREIVSRYALADNLFRLRVRSASSLIGKTVAEAEFGKNFNVTILELRRKAPDRTMVQLGDARLVWHEEKDQRTKPSVDTLFDSGDLLLVQGHADDVALLSASWNLGVQPAQAEDEQSLINQEVGMAEILLPEDSSLVGKSLVDLEFGVRYRLSVMGIRRPGSEEAFNLKTTPLRFGDTLLVQGSWENILGLRKNQRDFVVMGQPEEMLGPVNQRKAPIAAVILAGMLIVMIGDFMPLTTTAMLAGVLMILTGCLKIDEAYEFIDWKSIVLIAGMLPMSIALEQVGLVSLVAEGMINTLGAQGPMWMLAGLFLGTAIFTQLLSNTATTVLLAPLAFATAIGMGVQPHAFLMAVAIAASMAFASPVASPVNTLVMGAGNYRFSDYAKTGIPMLLIAAIVVLLVLPLLWPF
jgi:di/tricarboxylate transporter